VAIAVFAGYAALDLAQRSRLRLLRTAAAAWMAAMRQTDLIARYGGEEFVVVMPDCPLEDAVVVTDRLRAALPAGVTCSAG
jgi:diguanylate cyclase (GGDEF)-like protein